MQSDSLKNQMFGYLTVQAERYCSTLHVMAKQTTVLTELIDDLDGGKADRTISFAYEGKSYEIDLGKRNAAAFEKTMRTYVRTVH